MHFCVALLNREVQGRKAGGENEGDADWRCKDGYEEEVGSHLHEQA
jgi:hypothetical protein